MANLDINRLRQETPATAGLIHFNNAGASLPPTPVIEAVIGYLNDEATLGGYETEAKYGPQFKNIYSSVAHLINAKENEVALVESATRAWDRALSSIPFQKGDVILTSYSEYVSNYIALLQLQKHHGVQVEMISENPHKEFSLEDLKKKMSSKIKLIALTHVPSTNGLINQLEGVSEIARNQKAFFLLDACQSVGQIHIDVEKIGCDFLAATGRKFMRAPRGTGFLYARSEVLKELEPMFLDFTSADLKNKQYQIKEGAKRFENYETSFAARLGFGVAVDYALTIGTKTIEERVQSLANSLRKELSTLPNISVHDTGKHQSGIVTFSLKNQDSYLIAQKLREQKINVSVSSPSYALDLEAKGLSPVVRASIHYYNTEDEIQAIKEALKVII